jgi:colanic acid biosynthesis glycosyl transferase WcaI
MPSANQAVPSFVEGHSRASQCLHSDKHICLVDHGNYHFLFDLAANWPAHLGRMSYVFAASQLGKNTASSEVEALPSGGVVCGLRGKPAASADRFFARYRADAQSAKATLEQLNMLKPDVVIGANNPLDVQAQIAKWCGDHQRPFIFWLHDLRGMAVRSILQKRLPLLGGLVGKYYSHLESRSLKKSSHVISIADEFSPHILSAGLSEDQISVICNWAPIGRLPLRAKDNDWSRSVGLSGQRIVLYAGNLGMKHHPSHLIALCEAIKDQPDITVLVIAEGVGAEWLAEQAKARRLTNLFMYPFVKNELLPDVLGAADVYTVLLEPDASSFSVPSKIWTYFCGAKPLVLSIPKDNQGALIAEKIGVGISSHPSDPAQFVANCLRLLSLSPAERAKIGMKGRAFAEANFGIESIIRRVSHCIDLALMSHKGS